MIIDNKEYLETLSKWSNKLVKYKCDNCGKEGYRKYSLLNRAERQTCCNKCRTELNRKLHILDIETRLNVYSLKDYMYKLYIKEQKSIKEINDVIFGNKTDNCRITRDYLIYFKIPLRHGSEAIKAQYIGEKGINRKEKQSIVMSINSKNVDRSFMQTEEYKHKQSISKLGENNGMYGIRGERNPSWNPSKTRLQRQKDRKLHENTEWRTKVFKRDNYTCKLTGEKGKLVAHHLDGYDWCIEKRFDISNGITLREDIHKLFHKLYGYGGNTREQFEEFKQRYLNGEFALAE